MPAGVAWYGAERLSLTFGDDRRRVVGGADDVDGGHRLPNEYARSGDEAGDSDADRRRARALGDHRAVGENARDSRVLAHPRRLRADENRAALVGDRRGKVDRVADRVCGVGRWSQPDPRRAKIADRL